MATHVVVTRGDEDEDEDEAEMIPKLKEAMDRAVATDAVPIIRDQYIECIWSYNDIMDMNFDHIPDGERAWAKIQ
jgi:hypothetical protein